MVMVLNILCKVTGNGLHHIAYYHIIIIAWNKLNKAHTDCDKTLWHTSKLILLQYVSTDIYKVPYFD